MQLKNTVNPAGLSPEILLAITVAASIYQTHGAELVITSLNDSKHKEQSLHYSGNAVDFRVHNLADEATREKVAARLQAALPPCYDVLYEYAGTPNAHIHLEYDPPKPKAEKK